MYAEQYSSALPNVKRAGGTSNFGAHPAENSMCGLWALRWRDPVLSSLLNNTTGSVLCSATVKVYKIDRCLTLKNKALCLGLEGDDSAKC